MRDSLVTLRVRFGQPTVGIINRAGRTRHLTVKSVPVVAEPTEELRKVLVLGAERRLVPLSDLVALRPVVATATVECCNGYPMLALTANPAPDVALARAGTLREARVKEVRGELRLLAEYRLAWW
jgi:multidrug efflux pump subunit AcrB